MSECIHRSRLSDYLDDGLAPVTRESVARHLEADPPCGCARELREMEQLVAALGRLLPGEAPAGEWERLERTLDREGRKRSTRRWGMLLAAAAAGILVLVALPRPPADRTVATPQVTPAPALPLPEPREVPGLEPPPVSPFAALDAETTPPEWMPVRAPVGPPPVLLAAAVDADLPPLELPSDLLLRYGSEIAPVDRLIESLQALPEPVRERDEVRAQVRLLRDLKSDLYTEFVLQAQALRAAPWGREGSR